MRYLAIVVCLAATPLFAQYQTPTLDGTVADGEYANTSGNWAMTWNATDLYVGVKGLASTTSKVSVYVDVDPLSTPGGGTNANGSLSGYAELGNGASDSITPTLPFRADARLHSTSSGGEIRLANGSGGWGVANSNPADVANGTSSPTAGHREYRIAWSALGLAGPPSSFNWLGFEVGLAPMASPFTSLMNTAPDANPTGTASTEQRYFFNVASTADSASTNPFSVRRSTWRVTSSDDSGANTLREAFTNLNADSGSDHRYVTFALPGSTTIQLASSLTAISQTVTIDGTTQNGGSLPAVTIRGNGSTTGIDLFNAPNSVVRGLVLQLHQNGIRVVSAAATIESNYIGTTANGNSVSSSANTTGISITSAPGTVISNNVIGGSSDGILALSNSVTITSNRIGVGADNFSSIPNIRGLTLNGSNLIVGAPETPNTIANNERAIDVENDGGFVSRGNSMYAHTSAAVTISNQIMTPPTINSAIVTNGSLNVDFSLTAPGVTTTVRLDIYEADTFNLIPQGFTWRGSQCFLGNSFTNTQWAVGANYAAGEKYVFTATAYTDASCGTAGYGTSQFTTAFTTTGMKTFTGSGDFTDTSRWSTAELPTAGESFIIKGAATITAADPTLYGTVYLGSGSVTGALIFQSGSSLRVTNVTARTTGSSLEMENGGTLRVDGALDPNNLMLNAGNGTIEYGGSSQTLAALTYKHVSITGSITAASGTAIVTGNFNVSGSFQPAGGTVELRGGAIACTGSCTFRTLSIPATFGGTASTSFAVATAMIVNGTFTPTSIVVISGVGMLSGTGIINVTGTASPNSYGTQYALTRAPGNNVYFIGTAAQSIDAGTYAELRLNNALGATCNGTTIVNGTLSLIQGRLTATTCDLTVTSTGSTSTVLGWILGKLRRQIDNNAVYAFPLGGAAGATAVQIEFHGLTSPGIVSVRSTAGDHPQVAGSGIDSNRSMNLYWTVQNETAVFSHYDLGIFFSSASYDPTATPPFVLRGYDNSTTSWFAPSSGGSSFFVGTSGILSSSSLIDFAAGNQLLASYEVSATSPQSAGTPFPTTVTAKDILGVKVSEATNVITMSTTGSAQFDANGDGTYGDNQKALTAGEMTITTKDDVIENVLISATDGTTSASTQVTINLGPASPATSEITVFPTQVVANGSAQATVTVQVKDAGGNNHGTGGATVTLAIQSGPGSLGSVTDAGNGTYTATYTAGTQAGSAVIAGTLNGSPITDTATVTLVAGPATTLLVDAPANATGAQAFNVTVTARDANGNTATGYTGTVHFTSTAAAATLPGDYTFTGGDAGVHVFSVTLNSAGNIVLTATDTVSASITGNDTIAVKGNTVTTLASSSNPSVVGENVTFTATVSSPTTGTITGTVTFLDGATTIGSGPVGDNGVATFSTSSLSQGTHSITATYDGSTNFNTSTSNTVSQTVNLSPFGPPAIVTATASGTSAVTVSWTAVSGATSYRIYRSSGGSAFTLLNETGATSYPDSGLSANTTYVYRIAAKNGTESALSAPDAATTIVFIDASLTGVAVKAVHLTQLQTAVNAMRAAASLAPSSFASITPGTTIQATHVTQLRTALDAARSAIGLPALTYTNPTLAGASIKAVHITELRAGTQ